MKYLGYIWSTFVALGYLVLVIGVLSVTTTRFETVVLAGMAQLYAAVLHNFSVIGESNDANNLAGFIRFRILASAQGITANEDGTFVDQEKALGETINRSRFQIIIGRLANSAVSLYALYKIVQAILFG